jgi:transcriptional regulator with XRE-family HTH domain
MRVLTKYPQNAMMSMLGIGKTSIMTSVNPEFGRHLRALRLGPESKSWTQLALADAAQIRVSNVSDIERSRRPCGPDVASRLASALGIKGRSLIEFMSLAAKTTERGYLWGQSPVFEQLLIAITTKLQRQGVNERYLVSVSTVPPASRDQLGEILAVMNDCTRIYIKITTRIDREERR